MSVAPNTVGDPPAPGARLAYHCHHATVLIIGLLFCWSCGGGTTDLAEAAAEREGFIGAFLDMRVATVSSGSAEIGDAVRDSILSEYGVTEQDLLDFIDAHGEDVQFMGDLWTEVEARLLERLERNAQEAENDESDGSEDGEAEDGETAEDGDTSEDDDTAEDGDRDAGISP